jgi:hypothetical protein
MGSCGAFYIDIGFVTSYNKYREWEPGLLYLTPSAPPGCCNGERGTTDTVLPGCKRETIMKNTLVLTILGVVLVISVFICCGCAQLGETTAEGHRRHLRNLRINQQQLVEDIDKALLFEKPSKLTDKRIP